MLGTISFVKSRCTFVGGWVNSLEKIQLRTKDTCALHLQISSPRRDMAIRGISMRVRF